MTDRPLIEIVEDDSVVAMSLTALLDGYGYESIVYESAEAFLEATRPNSACVLMDVNLPGMNGLAALDAHIKGALSAPMVIVTGHGDVSMAVEALKSGAHSFIEKPYSDTNLIATIEAARTGSKSDPELEELMEKFGRLTKRETEVMHEVVEGAPNKMIAYRLGLSPKTVEIHRARVMEKTGAKSLSHLVRMAMKAGVDWDSDRRPED